MIRKEIGGNDRGFNLIRTIMAQAAILYEINPRTYCFKGAIQDRNAFQEKLDAFQHYHQNFSKRFYKVLLPLVKESVRVAVNLVLLNVDLNH